WNGRARAAAPGRGRGARCDRSGARMGPGPAGMRRGRPCCPRGGPERGSGPEATLRLVQDEFGRVRGGRGRGRNSSTAEGGGGVSAGALAGVVGGEEGGVAPGQVAGGARRARVAVELLRQGAGGWDEAPRGRHRGISLLEAAAAVVQLRRA